MPPYDDIPYAQAPIYCFPLTELCMYVLFILCVLHALKHGARNAGYLLGGVLFGLMLEYVNVKSNMGYTYGTFVIMLGKSPFNIPLCIGIGWGSIMYTARIFSDSFRLPLWSAPALDTLLAISIDISMDAVAYRLHMWHWNWSGTGLNPLTADWFGVPFGNFFGWLLVVFFYSSISRLLETALSRGRKMRTAKYAIVPLLSIVLSQVLLYVMLVYVDDYLKRQFGITSLHRFITFLIILVVIAAIGIRKCKPLSNKLPAISWLVPIWFHVYFFIWLFAAGFYRENKWLVIAATVNVLLGVAVHFLVVQKKREEGIDNG